METHVNNKAQKLLKLVGFLMLGLIVLLLVAIIILMVMLWRDQSKVDQMLAKLDGVEYYSKIDIGQVEPDRIIEEEDEIRYWLGDQLGENVELNAKKLFFYNPQSYQYRAIYILVETSTGKIVHSGTIRN